MLPPAFQILNQQVHHEVVGMLFYIEALEQKAADGRSLCIDRKGIPVQQLTKFKFHGALGLAALREQPSHAVNCFLLVHIGNEAL